MYRPKKEPPYRLPLIAGVLFCVLTIIFILPILYRLIYISLFVST